MKFSTSFLLAPLAILATSAAASPAPIAGLTSVSINDSGTLAFSSPTESGLVRRAVTGTVTENSVRYRTCAYTTCTPIGQYHKGHVVTMVCLVWGEVVGDGVSLWARLSNGYYMSIKYIQWQGSLNIC